MSDQTAAERMRRYRERKRQGGRKEHHLWLTEAEASAVRDLVERGEDLSAIAARLVGLLDRAERAEYQAKAQHQRAEEAERRVQQEKRRTMAVEQERKHLDQKIRLDAVQLRDELQETRAELAKVKAELADWKANAVLIKD